ncbi:hypothetical protein ABTK05_19735, partial [Acinetobacter baumannii]
APRIAAPSSFVYPSFSRSLLAEANTKAEAGLQAFVTHVRAKAQDLSVPCDLTPGVEDLASAGAFAAGLARCADLAVVDRPGQFLDPGSALFTS